MNRAEGNGWFVRWDAFELRVGYERGGADDLTPGELRTLSRASKQAVSELCSGSGTMNCMCNGCEKGRRKRKKPAKARGEGQ
jgi:hypothetical protein